jgi:hypothetical protein
MKKGLSIAMVTVLLALAGCFGSRRTNSNENETSNNKGTDVIIEGKGEFPEFLVGRWKANEGGWQFVFEPDGTISSAVISMGRITMYPGEIARIPMKMGGISVFEPGPWLVHYIPKARELTVSIAIENFYSEMGGGVVEGSVRDIFVGTVDEDALTWKVSWTNFLNARSHTKKHPNFDLSNDPDYGDSRTITFEKVS